MRRLRGSHGDNEAAPADYKQPAATNILPVQFLYKIRQGFMLQSLYCAENSAKIEHAVRLQIQLALELEQFLKCKDGRTDTGREDGAVRSIRQKQAAQAAKLEQLLFDYNEGTIDKEEYLYIKQRYDQAARQLETELEEAETDRERFVQTVSMAERWIGKIKEFSEKGRLDRELVECLIDRVNVYEGRKVEIFFTFKDEYRDMLTRHVCREEVPANAAKEA